MAPGDVGFTPDMAGSDLLIEDVFYFGDEADTFVEFGVDRFATNAHEPQLNDTKIKCIGKITNFNETEDGRITLILQGISRFKILTELDNKKLYREFEVSYDEFKNDLNSENEFIDLLDSDDLFVNLKSLFNQKGYIIDWEEINKNKFDQIINTLSMISPFSLEEKQILLEINTIEERKKKLNEILNIYLKDNFQNKTLQ